MIVSEYFKGDTAVFQWMQHDAYRQSIAIIFNGCRNHYLEQFKNDPNNAIIPDLIKINSFDHRILQPFHDHLAAHWRKKYFDAKSTAEENQTRWYSWLKREIGDIRENPQTYIGICLLSLDKYDADDKKRIVEFIEIYAKRTYPYKGQHYFSRISIESLLPALYTLIAIVFGISCMHSGLVSPTGTDITLVLGILFFIGYLYANNKKLHELCIKNVFCDSVSV